VSGKDRQTGGATYVLRALPGPGYRLTGSLARAQVHDRERIAALKRVRQAGSDSSAKPNSAA
jgi:hypothetical protein